MVLTAGVIGLVGCSSESSPPATPEVPHDFRGPTAAFYRVPEPLPDAPHGSLVRYQRLDDVGHGRVYRVMYTSRSVSGQPIVVTGLTALPENGGRDRVVLTWAHGTSGIADSCAPSKQPLGILAAVLDVFLQRGWIVTATDYEGLGTPGRHPYIAGISEGRSTLDAIRAAAQLPGAHAGRRALIWGHSQGGHAAMFAAELAPRWTPERRVLGTVSGAPPSHFDELIESLRTSDYRGYVALAAAGIHAAYPRARLSQVLTAKGRALLPVVDRACTDDVFRAFNAVPLDDVVKANPTTVEPWRTILAANEPGRVITRSPLLIIHGEADEQIPPSTSQLLFDELCARGQPVERRTYPGQSHAGVILPSFAPMLQWMDDRVAGKPAVSGCP